MTYDPIKIIEKPKVGAFTGLPSAGPGAVLVVDRAGHPVRVLEGPGDRLTAGEVRWGQIRTLYAVDTTDHQLQFSNTLPCADDVGGFRATIELSCAVADPAAVVNRGIHDVASVIVPRIVETLRRVCGDFPAEQSDLAEEAGLAAVRNIEAGPGHDPAFRIVRCHIVLALDDAAAAYVRERKETSRNLVRQQDAARLEAEKTKLEAELARTRDKLGAEHGRLTAGFDQERLVMQREQERLEAQLEDQRQELELARAAARAREEHKSSTELELQRLEFEAIRQQKQAELDAQKLSLDIERARLGAQYERMQLEAKLERDQLQITQLTELLGRGEFAGFAMQLAADPTSIDAINAHLADRRDADINRQLHALKLLLENDGLEGFQVTEQAKSILIQLINNWSSRGGQSAALESSTPAEIESGEGEIVSADDSVIAEEFPGDRQEPEVLDSDGEISPDP